MSAPCHQHSAGAQRLAGAPSSAAPLAARRHAVRIQCRTVNVSAQQQKQQRHPLPAAAATSARHPRLSRALQTAPRRPSLASAAASSRRESERGDSDDMEVALRDVIAFPAHKAGTPSSALGMKELADYLALELSSEQLVALANSADKAISRAEGQARDWAILNMEELSTDALLVVVQFAFSLWYVIGKSALSGGTDPLAFAMIREALASGVLWAMALKLEGPFRLDHPEDGRKFGVLGLLCCLNVCGFLKGLSYVSELQASIMQPLVPVVVMGFCGITGVERLTGRAKIGVLLSSAGAVAATVSAAAGSDVSGAGDGGDLLLGSSIIMVQILAYSGLMVYQKDLSSRYSPLTMTACYYSIGAILTVLLDLACQGFDISHVAESVQPFTAFPPDGALWGAMSYAVVVATVFTFSAMTYASSKVSANTVSVYSALQPLFSLALGLAVFHQQVNLAEVGSGGLIIGGLLLAVGNDAKDEEEEAVAQEAK